MKLNPHLLNTLVDYIVFQKVYNISVLYNKSSNSQKGTIYYKKKKLAFIF